MKRHTHTKRSVPNVNVRFNKDRNDNTDRYNERLKQLSILQFCMYEVEKEAAIHFYQSFQCFYSVAVSQNFFFIRSYSHTGKYFILNTHSAQSETRNRKRIAKQKKDRKNDRVNGRRKKEYEYINA